MTEIEDNFFVGWASGKHFNAHAISVESGVAHAAYQDIVDIKQIRMTIPQDR